MTYFKEIDWDARRGGLVRDVERKSLAFQAGIRPGDELLAVNRNRVNDVIDVNFYGAEETIELLVRRGTDYLVFELEREYGQTLGLEFDHPTFDTDIHRCNNLCEFCFVLQMAPRFRRTLYIKDDDYRYSFLFGHFVTLTNLKDEDWQRIQKMGLSPLYVSVHVTDLEMRRKFLRNDAAPDILMQLSWLRDRAIKIHTQIVVVPEFNDGEWLRKSIADLADFWPSVRSISVVPVGLTRFHKYGMRVHTAEEANRMVAELEAMQPEFRKRFGRNFIYPTDEWYIVAGREIPPLASYDGLNLQENGLGMVRDFLEEWATLKKEISISRPGKDGANGRSASVLFRSITLATGTLFAGTLEEIAAEFARLTDTEITVVGVENRSLGRTITVAGLLNASDIVEQLLASGHGELLVLPMKAFDHPDRISLDDYSPQAIADKLNVIVALAESMGDVWDAITGRSSLAFTPKGRDAPSS